MEIRVGIVGLGTVGSGVAERILKDSGLEKRTGVRLVLGKCFDPRPEAMAALPAGSRAGAADEIINDPKTGIVVEAIGGTTVARGIVMESIRSKKHVVTANKTLLAAHGKEIFSEAEKRGVLIGFEASVGGTIPIVSFLQGNADNIKCIRGILNGTTNYVLTRMEKDGMEYSEALKEAQKKGFAEADPAMDVDGTDSAQKIAILAYLGFGRQLTTKGIKVKGITGIRIKDIENAKKTNSVIKLIATAQKTKEGLFVEVKPERVPKAHLLSRVEYEQNAILVEGENTGPILFIGAGAGKKPTADAIIRDIVRIARQSR